MSIHQPERHRLDRVGWLRAAVLGANDGLISTSSLLSGMIASAATRSTVILTGFAGLCAGSLSMAAGEYVSVSAQADAEAADTERERRELVTLPDEELAELTAIYIGRGVSPSTAALVAADLHRSGALEAHLRDELGFSEHGVARPLQAALASAAAFACGAFAPVVIALAAPRSVALVLVVGVTVLALAVLGIVGARLGGAPWPRPTLRVLTAGIAAMAFTALVGRIVGAAI